MAVYNGEEYLHSSINSVLKQTFSDFELIIIDDCSNDKTYNIINDFKDSRIVYSRNIKNIGQTPSLNIGVKLSKGKYIARIDADDLYIDNKLEKQFYFMEKNPEITVCGTQSKCIDENGNIYSSRLFPKTESDIVFRSFFQSPIMHVSAMIRKSEFEHVGFYNEEFPICADFELWSRMIIKGHKLVNLNENLTMFRIVKNSLSFSNKSGISGKETSLIIQQNLKKIIGLELSYEECHDIVMMLWPSERKSINKLLGAYENLIKTSKFFFNGNVPMNKIFFIDKILIKSLIKRFLYNLEKNETKYIFIDFKNVLTNNLTNPKVIAIYCISFFVTFLNGKILNKVKILTSS
jgi:glycosyltransferase involved in cell wall biosynthesis